MYKHPLLDRDKMTPREALDILIEGNQRFVNNYQSDKDFQSLVQIVKNKQHPFTAVLSCSDSRAPTELLFDQALGDVFSVRLAGNIATDKAIGSLEFACKYLGAKLIVVMGHTSCGAVKAACDDFKDGHIGEIINFIKPSLRFEKSVTNKEDRCSANPEFVEKINALNVRHQIETIIRQSDIVDEMLENDQIAIVGAIYDLENGHVDFMQDTYVGKI
jgi:carbonic anhydrase